MLEVNGGRVVHEGGRWRLTLPPIAQGYADAQMDDYGGRPRRAYGWRPGVELRLRARFSHPAGTLSGTAGFGFWNAPYGDPRLATPALPQATWFFYGSAPTDLPLAADGAGRGWFASTLDAGSWQALATAPLAPIVLLLNQLPALRRRLWPAIRLRLGVTFQPIAAEMTGWRDYYLSWQRAGCLFQVDGQVVLATRHSPRGPLGFVCWIDNQYLIATPRGRVRWGSLATTTEQWLEVTDLTVSGRPWTE